MASTLSLCVLITLSLPLAIFANIDNSRLDNQIPDRICDVVKDGVLLNSPGIVDNLATCTAICETSTQCQAAVTGTSDMNFLFQKQDASWLRLLHTIEV